ncbi:LysR family transcriptional regulator [Ralstonia solanacearum]|uniref:LysR substrate-binding domain-containing protein n=1 Tax=Ralstonia solanacearum TaxID=305 RepID=UPI000710F5E7|nr:LysR substrate-binding domain-containing protein [Ralstonia solanacearum]MBB6591727.1 LysR family transcriptional regulator [Ralstonia solanacearum]MBB6595950.1 LysR family transcriptional regulator [Ralstonia solanacearum]MDB0544575.1 LysR family transcriptional regulator [Ralstonia solanacearum]MDB0554382.1 LysR family transcriptional regulator [Ralstonia solanacearum]MDB0559496.1 LysR family transcriptional regulator [Ralstonia solanacearum]
MRISPLPPLHFLIAFEAVVRHSSFTRAAVELHLTQSAVSRQIGQLEAFLGRSLFEREPRRALQLTVAGKRYADRVRRLLEQCSDATHDVMKRYGDLDLAVACSSGVATLWLAPRIGSFHASHPNINLRIIVRDSFASLTPSEFDVGLYYLREKCGPQFNAQPLIDEEVFPVCSPRYLDGRIMTPEELTHQTLLMQDDRQLTWMSWDEWLGLNGVAMPKKPRAIVSNHYPQLVQMALHGYGILLGWRQIIDYHLETKSLVRATRETATFGGGYHVLTPNDRAMNRAATLFSSWLLQQCAMTSV